MDRLTGSQQALVEFLRIGTAHDPFVSAGR
jgi:hypothetical protein